MARIFIVGLPRSGTTWLSRTMARAPGVRYVHEPDNRRVEPLAFVGTLGLGSVPWLAPGAKAPDYRRLWAMAFAGGWPESHPVVTRLHRLARSNRVPRQVRIALFRRAAGLAGRRRPEGEHQVVKSVGAYLSIDWVAQEFDPTMVVVWRHPLNMAPAWVDQGWEPTLAAPGMEAVRNRFERTAVWPPPEGDGLIQAAWHICARSALMLETVARHPDWTVISHEQQCLDPTARFTELFGRIGLTWTPELRDMLAESNRPGTGYTTQREWKDEPLRWRTRLESAEQESVTSIVHSFEEVSQTAAAFWRSSPAVAGVR